MLYFAHISDVGCSFFFFFYSKSLALKNAGSKGPLSNETHFPHLICFFPLLQYQLSLQKCRQPSDCVEKWNCQLMLPKPKSQKRNFWVHFWKPGRLCKLLSILHNFIPLLFALASDHSSTVSFWDFLVSQTRITTTNPTSQAKRDPELFPGEDCMAILKFSLPAAFCLRNELSFLLLPRDTPSLLMTWLKLTASTCFLTKDLISELKVGQERSPAESSKNLLYDFLFSRKAAGSVWSGIYLGISYVKSVHNFILFISYILV